jgi:hypothetical protein
MLATLALLLLIWAAVAAISWRSPEPARKWWRAWNRLASTLARKKALSYLIVASLPLLLRAVLLPLWPMPDPYIQDEFSYVLQADTFAHGRVTNPSPALPEFFESGQILVRPSYASKYPPGHSLVMSIGQRLLGNPWFGAWLSCGALSAALFWALNGWFPPSWALFGTLLALPLCSFSYWMNSYMGGAVAAIGGALVVGAYPRLVRKKNGAAWTLAAGCVLLIFTRPFEGLLIVVPALAFCLHARINPSAWARIACIALTGAVALSYYNQRITGDPLRLPYFEYQAQYQSTPQFNVQSPSAPKQFRYEGMRLIDEVWERTQWENARRLRFLVDRPLQWLAAAGMFAGATGSFLPVIALRASVVDQNAVFNLDNLVHIFLRGAMVLVPVALFAWPLATNRRTRFAFALVATSIAGSFFSAAFYQHYAAPAVAPILVLVTGSYRYLRYFNRPVGQVPDLPQPSRQVGNLPHFGSMLALLIPLCAIGLSLLDGAPALLHEPAVFKVATRSRLEETVKEHPGKHLIIVRYTTPLRPIEEWVYNGSDLDAAPVIWSHDLGAQENRRLIAHFHDREVWLFQPNIDPDWIAPYRE